MMKLQPYQSSFEISTACDGEGDARIIKGGGVAIGIRKRECATLCHVPRPVGPADSSCDLLKDSGLTAGGSIKQLTGFDYADSEADGGVRRLCNSGKATR